MNTKFYALLYIFASVSIGEYIFSSFKCCLCNFSPNLKYSSISYLSTITIYFIELRCVVFHETAELALAACSALAADIKG